MANVAVTNTFVAGTSAVAAQVNTNFSDIVTWLNNRNAGSDTWGYLKVTSTVANPVVITSSAATTEVSIDNTATDGDPLLTFRLSGSTKYTFGIDDSDGDKFKIGTTGLTASNSITIDGADITIGGLLNFGSPTPIGLMNFATYYDAGGLTGRVGIDLQGNWGDTVAHPIIVETQHELANGLAACAYDSQLSVIGSNNTSHLASFQSRLTNSSTGTLTDMYGFVEQHSIASGCTTTNSKAFYADNVGGLGTLTNQYGLYVETLTKGASSNFAIYTAGATKSYLGGFLGLGVAPTHSLDIYKATLPIVAITNSASATGFWLYQNGVNAFISNQEAGSLSFQTSGTDALVISAAGVTQLKSSATGSTTAQIGASNCPATTGTAPYVWFKMAAPDGSTVYVPGWK